MLTPFGYFLLLIIFVLIVCYYVVFRFFKGIYEIKKLFSYSWKPRIELVNAALLSKDPAIRSVINAWWFHRIHPFDIDRDEKCVRRLFQGLESTEFIESGTFPFTRESKEHVIYVSRYAPRLERQYYFSLFDTNQFIDEGITSDAQMNSMPIHLRESARDHLREMREKNEEWFRTDIVFLRIRMEYLRKHRQDGLM